MLSSNEKPTIMI